jgi:chemotaxis protein histidine kinase CheA
MFDKKLSTLVRRAASAQTGEITLTVREIRDEHWNTSRLTSRDRKKIDEEFKEAGVTPTPALGSGVGLDEAVRLTHVERNQAHRKLQAQRATDLNTVSGLVEEIKRSPEHPLSFTQGQLAQRFGRRTAKGLSPDDRASIVSALSSAGIMSEPPLAPGVAWSEKAAVVLSLPQSFKLGRTGKRVLAGIAAFVVLILVIGALGGGGDPEPAEESAAVAESTQTETETEAPQATTDATPVDQAAEAAAAEDDGDYEEAIALFVAAGDDDEANRVRNIAALALVRQARSSYRDAKYKTARRQAERAIASYGSRAKGATRIRNQSRSQLRAISARRAQAAEARRVAAAERRAARSAARAQARADEAAAQAAQDAADAAEAAPEPDYDSGGGSSSGGRAGCNPATARDGDGDGIVCE